MDFTEMGVFHGRTPISRKMSRPWNRELGWSLPMPTIFGQHPLPWSWVIPLTHRTNKDITLSALAEWKQNKIKTKEMKRKPVWETNQRRVRLDWEGHEFGRVARPTHRSRDAIAWHHCPPRLHTVHTCLPATRWPRKMCHVYLYDNFCKGWYQRPILHFFQSLQWTQQRCKIVTVMTSKW